MVIGLQQRKLKYVLIVLSIQLDKIMSVINISWQSFFQVGYNIKFYVASCFNLRGVSRSTSFCLLMFSFEFEPVGQIQRISESASDSDSDTKAYPCRFMQSFRPMSPGFSIAFSLCVPCYSLYRRYLES